MLSAIARNAKKNRRMHHIIPVRYLFLFYYVLYFYLFIYVSGLPFITKRGKDRGR